MRLITLLLYYKIKVYVSLFVIDKLEDMIDGLYHRVKNTSYHRSTSHKIACFIYRRLFSIKYYTEVFLCRSKYCHGVYGETISFLSINEIPFTIVKPMNHHGFIYFMFNSEEDKNFALLLKPDVLEY